MSFSADDASGVVTACQKPAETAVGCERQTTAASGMSTMRLR